MLIKYHRYQSGYIGNYVTIHYYKSATYNYFFMGLSNTMKQLK